LYIQISWCKLPFPLFMNQREATVLVVYYLQIDLSSDYIVYYIFSILCPPCAWL
jgi:hypothetical protein